MLLLDVPHYRQDGGSDCQAACAAMVLDYFAGRRHGGTPERLGALLDEFSFGFTPEAGGAPPAITGLVAMAIAKRGFTVDFYSENPDGVGVEGLGFLTGPPWDFTQEDVQKYAEHATRILADAAQSGLTIHASCSSEEEVENAIRAGKPVVAIVDLAVLEGWDRSANHAVVITGIDKTHVRINDPNGPEAHQPYERELFFAAHLRDETDCDAYEVSDGSPGAYADLYECWELDGHILANVRGKEYVIDTGSPSTFTSEENLRIGKHIIATSEPPPGLLETLQKNVAPGVVGLIGIDVMNDFDVSISLGERVIQFCYDTVSLPGSRALPIEHYADALPVLKNLEINTRPIHALLDLGARFSYLDMQKGEHGFGTGWDFWPLNPSADRFPVRLHNVTLKIANRDCPLTAGNRADVVGLPDIEIIGSEILKYFDINISMRRNLIEFLPIN